MKKIPACLLLFTVINASSQEVTDCMFIFSGYVLDSDSVPVEGAYVLNCRTLKTVTTDASGYFRTRVQTGDSLVINHISYQRMFVHANQHEAVENIFLLSFCPYEVGQVTVSDYTYELANFRKNIANMNDQIKRMEGPVDYKTGSNPQTVNPYSPGAKSPGFGVNLLDLFPKKK